METNKSILMRGVVSIGERKTVGMVKDLFIDCDTRSVSNFMVSDFDHGTARLLPYREVRAVGNSFITINRETAFLDRTSKTSKELLDGGFKLVGVEVFSGDGDKIGTVGGYSFSPKNGSISSITLTDGTEYAAKSVLFFSPEYVFIDSDPSAVVAAQEPVSETKDSASASELSEDDKALRELLVGKKVSEDVKSDDGEFVLEKNEVITEEVFLEAAAHEALLGLTASIDV